MDLEKLITELKIQKNRLDDLLPMSKEQKRKLDQKYRLEWNFHSNHIEGNTLTYGETQLLLLNGKVTGDHEVQEIEEMQAHDVAIEMIKEWAHDKDRLLTEADLRQLNKVILVKPFFKEAYTEDGQPTRKEIIPGQYKSSPNSVKLRSGSMHHYASPEETPALMHELFDKYREYETNHPIIMASSMHHRLTQIHPFDDGNGRVARLWANHIILQAGYPPLIIRTENKTKYLTALEKADAGNFEAFVEFMATELMWSISLSKKAAKGESLEEPGDVDKKMALLEQKINSIGSEETKVQRSQESVEVVIRDSFIPLVNEIDDKLIKAKSWFNEFDLVIYFDGSGKTYKSSSDLSPEALLSEIDNKGKHMRSASLQVRLSGFKKGGTRAFDIDTDLEFVFENWKYSVSVKKDEGSIVEKLYHNQLLETDIDLVVKRFLTKTIERIESQVDNISKN